jgi:hypothetical protein
VSVSWFRDHGVEFSHGVDDLDACDFGAILLDNAPVGFLHYENEPSEQTTLLFPMGAPLHLFIEAVAREFSLPLRLFKWRQPEAMEQQI